MDTNFVMKTFKILLQCQKPLWFTIYHLNCLKTLKLLKTTHCFSLIVQIYLWLLNNTKPHRQRVIDCDLIRPTCDQYKILTSDFFQILQMKKSLLACQIIFQHFIVIFIIICAHIDTYTLKTYCRKRKKIDFVIEKKEKKKKEKLYTLPTRYSTFADLGTS